MIGNLVVSILRITDFPFNRNMSASDNLASSSRVQLKTQRTRQRGTN